jgi:hypothetical protein
MADEDHYVIDHYTSPERLSSYFAGDWNILLTLRTGQAGQPEKENHEARV